MTSPPGSARFGRRRRRSIRLPGYDYAQAGAYFVTVCSLGRECFFGDVVDGVMAPNAVAQIVEDTWIALPERFPSLDLDEFVVMPNHFHGIVVLGTDIPATPANVGAGLALPCLAGRGAASSAPTRGSGPAPSSAPTRDRAPTLGDVVRAFKSISAIQANRILGRSGQPLWQRNYYEHIIRNERSLESIRQYIIENPARWAFDRENPRAVTQP